MRFIRAPIIFPVLLFFLSCVQDNPFSSRAASKVSLNIVLPKAENLAGEGQGLNKTTAVAEVWLYVYADDMDDIEEILDISSDGTEASGSVEVPRGEARTFEIECYDQNEILQYGGETTVDILEKTETVEIVTVGYGPEAVENLNVWFVWAREVGLAWTQSQDDDFQEYLVLRATSPNMLSDLETLRRIFNPLKTGYIDSTAAPNSEYYYAIMVRDTEEMLGDPSPVRGVRTAELVEIIYDDGSWEDYFWGNEEGDCFDVWFSSPDYPCYIRSIKLNLRDQSGADGNYRVYVQDLGLNDLFFSEPAPTDPATVGFEGGWVTWKLNWENRAAGTVNEDFYAGIAYTSAILWPDIFVDTNTDADRSYYYDAATDTWSGIIGNLCVRVFVEIGGGLLKAPLSKVQPGNVIAAILEQVEGEAPTSESRISLKPELVLNPDPQASKEIRTPRPARTVMQKYSPLRSKQKPTH